VGDVVKNRIFLMSPAIFIMLAFGVVPLFIMLYYSFLSDGPSPTFTLQNYANFFQKAFYLKLTWKTIQMSLIVTLISIVIAYPAAYIIAKVIQRGQNLLLLFIIIPFWTSQLVRAYSWMNLLQDGGILEMFLRKLHLIGDGSLGILFTQTAVIISLVHIFFPYMVLTIYMSLDKIQPSLLEASKSLGATPFETFRRIVLPLSKPGIVTGSILVFVPCLGVFAEPRILGGPNGSVIGTVIEDQFFEINGWSFGAAIAFILLVMVFLSIWITSRLIKRGD
jgi:spermidine/putrescine transport system permease protein